MRYLFFVVITISFIACKDKAAIAAAEAAAEQARLDSLAHRSSPEVKKICLDTAWLRQHGFTYQLLRTANAMQWTISYPAQFEALHQVTAANFIYTALSDTACSSLSMQLTTIILEFGSRKQELPIAEYYINTLPGLLSPDIQFDDYNFDGQTDISVFSPLQSGNSHEVRHYFLFDKLKNQFFESTLFKNAIVNGAFDPVSKTILSSRNSGGGNWGTWLYRYISNDSLLLLERTDQEFHDSLNAYIRIEQKRLNDGTYAETIDTILRSEIE